MFIIPLINIISNYISKIIKYHILFLFKSIFYHHYIIILLFLILL